MSTTAEADEKVELYNREIRRKRQEIWNYLEPELPVVLYGVKRRLAGSQTDYWEFATLLELYVLAKDQHGATTTLSHVLAEAREPWQTETTTRNLQLIREQWKRRGEETAWVPRPHKATRGAGVAVP